MQRRQLLSGLGASVVAGQPIGSAVPALAQAPNRTYRLGHLASAAPSETFTRQITLPELARLGFVEGRNLVFDARYGEPPALPGLMAELLAARPDAIIAVGPAMPVASKATRTVPIVSFGSDPIELGLAAGYARPGGNVTGVVILASELEIKRLSILQEGVPGLRRIAVLLPATGWGGTESVLRQAAAGSGIDLLLVTAATPGDYRAAFDSMRARGAEALLVGATPQFQRDGELLAGLALEARLPTVCEWAEMARDGCLIGYGPSRTALRQRMADQIAQIFRGVAPGDIAIERPRVFELAVNQKVAKALNLSIPVGVLARADEVID